jgi:hypothetical protein
MFHYYEETGEWLSKYDLDEAYKEFLKKEIEYIDSMVEQLKDD